MKQVILIRKDLKMRRGKECAQAAHASSMFMMNLLYEYIVGDSELKLSTVQWEWMTGSYKKICVSVDSEEELLEIVNRAKNESLEVNVVTDLGLTEFTRPTITAAAIGPDEDHLIDKITSHLKLY